MIEQLLQVEGSTLPFRAYRQGGEDYIEFDSTGCPCPIPMINAMAGLARSVELGAHLVMINGFEPEGLYDRIRGHFQWRVHPLDATRIRVVFTPIPGRAAEVDFSQRHCSG